MNESFEGNKNLREATLSAKLETFFTPAYKVTRKVLESHVKNDMEIADLGCSDGVLEQNIDDIGHNCTVHGVDTNEEALENLTARQLQNVETHTHAQDAISFLEEIDEPTLDLIIANNSLHEIIRSGQQAEDLDAFLQLAMKKLKDGGRLILADHYYAPDIPDEEVETYREIQLKEVQHADPRENFIQPEIMKAAILRNNLVILESEDVRATPDINKRYYYFVVSPQKDTSSETV